MQSVKHEELLKKLENEDYFEEYRKKHIGYQPSAFARFFGSFVIFLGNALYGKEPSYQKFRSLEVIARIPYQSISVASFTLLTLFYANEERALRLAKRQLFARVAQDNETMHVIVISQLAKKHSRTNHIFTTIVPIIVSFIYFWISYLVNLFTSIPSLEINYIFEKHAFEQYDTFIKKHESELKMRPIESAYLDFYGRPAKNEYDFLRRVRNDELIHRNESIEQIEAIKA